MRKNIARKCLCIALASAMMLGEAGTAMAASVENAADGRTAATVAAEEQADVAAANVSIWYAGAYKNSRTITINASGQAYRVEVWVNGVKCGEQYNGEDQQSFSINCEIPALLDSTYNAEVRAYDSNGEVTVQKVSPVKTDKVSFDGDPSVSVGYTVGSTGYAKPGYVSVSVYLDSRHSDEVKYEVQRATKSGGPFTTIATESESYTSRLAYLDSTAKTGTTYYYRFRIVSGSDQYVKTSKVIATSKTASVKVGIPEVDQLYASSMNVSEKISKPGVFLWMTSNFANQYDVYRSTNKSKGYRKIKTIYSADFTDTAVKSGTVYYYKVVPKYYDSQTRKITTGKTSGVVGVKFIMNAAGAPSLIQTGNRSLKCTWAADNTADVSYEVWAKRTDITGDAYKRMVVTKKNSCTLTKLDSNGTYKVMIRTVKKSGAAVRYETTDTSERTMGYTKRVQDLTAGAVSSSLNGKKDVLSVRYSLTWYRDWGASGYVISGLNSSTGKIETIKKITSGKKTSYTFTNTSAKGKERKYSQIYVRPYKGKARGEDNTLWNSEMPSAKRVKAVKKSTTSTKITWSAVSGAKEYYVYRTTELGVRQYIGSTKATNFTDVNVTDGMKYTYSVVVGTDFGFSSGYDLYSSDYTHKLASPAITKVVNGSKGTATVTWKKVTNATRYYVYRSTSKNGTYKLVGKTGATKLSYMNKKLKKGTTYYYKVVASTVNDGGKTVKSVASHAKGIRIRK